MKPVKTPTKDQVLEIASELGFSIDRGEELDTWHSIVTSALKPYETIASLPDYVPGVKYPRVPGRKPTQKENEHNAWYVKTEIRGASSGPLSGRTVVIKDNICLAGVPMMNGSLLLEGYIPEVDATIITRLLDAGATIVGKSNCEELCISGGSLTCANGVVYNPRKKGHMTGGSSSGSAALVAAKEVDLAIGTDTAGSVRIPSSFCGCYGMKPSFGLVSCNGVFPIEATLDHVGPITSNVYDNALLLELMAGRDEYDSRTFLPHNVKHDYTSALGRDINGIKIAMLKEGFEFPTAQHQVNEMVKTAMESLSKLGAKIAQVSVPAHKLGKTLWDAIGFEGSLDQAFTNAYGTGHKSLYVTSMATSFAKARASSAHQLSDNVKACLIAGKYARKELHGQFYCKAQNLGRWLAKKYNKVLRDYDLILMPTIPFTAPKTPDSNVSKEEFMEKTFATFANTCAFNITGHPAMSIPCGMVDGLPVGMMLVGKYYDEHTIYSVAHAFEKAVEWESVTITTTGKPSVV